MIPLLTDPVGIDAVPALDVEVEAAARLALLVPDPGISRSFELPRARAGLGVGVGHAAGYVRLTAVRSTSTDGYAGVDGEAWVAEVDLATAQLLLPEVDVRVSAGLVPDLWSATSEAAWGDGGLWATPGERFGWMDAADLGGSVTWNGWQGRVGAGASLTTGEGANWRERNEGKDLAGIVTVAPLGSTMPRGSVYVRNGSRGLGLARDHRLAGRVDGGTPRLGWGVEVIKAWGVDGDATRSPLGGSAWVQAQPWGPLTGAARLDLATEALERADAGTVSWLAAAGVRLDEGAVELRAGASQVRRGDAVRAVAGADALAVETTFFLHLQAHLRFTTRQP